ncbi:hypothetical protein M3672_12005 [Microbacterium enclense]|uniref:Uncharacterized protein n=1 Tax=Microbacterium enclense TaxID=993073 RepID=A0A1G6QCT3_9MICO|nr:MULTISPECIES: hypothetical protein [Microbacterium]KSU52236.1 hypothetical protein AS029_14705 [Microbacterium enclense]MCM3615156.1 hypothetical protein [Microbacterium enclense]SDC89487.1 hypothetical protein SAMN05216418_3227 [Microbacterium enclense]
MTDATRAPEPSTGPDGGADAADSVGGAVHRDRKLSRPDEQSAPAMDTHPTDDEARIQGVVVQTRADVGDKSEERIADVLRQRFADIGLDLGDDRIRALAAEVAGG